MKQKAFIIFTDIDDTYKKTKWPDFEPVQTDAISKLVELSNELKKEGIITKVCFVSARPAHKVREQMVELNSLAGFPIAEYAMGEQGTVFVKKNGEVPMSKDLIETIEKMSNYVMQNYGDRVVMSTGSICSQYFGLGNKEKFLIDGEPREFIKKLNKELKLKFESVNLDFKLSDRENGIIVFDPRYDKDTSIDFLFSKYQQKYNIVGMTYSGDEFNDVKAIKYMAKVAEIPGIKVNIFIPQNAREFINESMEDWKDKINGSTKVIKRAEHKYFRGVIDLICKAHKEGSLIGRGASFELKDDMNLTKEKNKLNTKQGMQRGM